MHRVVVLLAAVWPVAATAGDVVVGDTSALRSALRSLEPGVRVLVEPGVYEGGLYVGGLSGSPGRPIVIGGRDPNNPPEFRGGGQAIHLSDCSHIVLRNLKVRGFPSNGVNIDDGGAFDTPAHHIVLENITILETGPRGNHDALKMSGVDDFVVRRCRFEGWGGSGIDMVGCHRGVVEDCVFVGRQGFEQSNAVQLKGGTTDILVQCCLFRDAGQRAINLGGSTGLEYFRPRVDHYEASRITVAGNRFIGSMAPIAWVTADGGHVHHNTIITPDKWVLRILQETRDQRFRPCHDGVFEQNLVVFDSRVGVFVNVGPGTSPETFRFTGNIWYDLEAGRKPELPLAEEKAIYQPELVFGANWRVDGMVEPADEPLRPVGASGYRRPYLSASILRRRSFDVVSHDPATQAELRHRPVHISQ